MQQYLWRIISTPVSGDTSHSALTRQATNQGIHYTLCGKPYLQKYKSIGGDLCRANITNNLLCTLEGFLQYFKVRHSHQQHRLMMQQSLTCPTSLT